MRRFIIPTDADLLKQISRGIPEKTVQAVLAYFYGVMFLAAVQGQGAVTPREEVEEALRRLIGDTTAEHDIGKSAVSHGMRGTRHFRPGAVAAAPGLFQPTRKGS